MGTLYKDKRIYKKQLCDEFFLEKENFPNEFVDKIKKGYFTFKYLFSEYCVVYVIIRNILYRQARNTW
jgi:hypothetical protein